MRMIALIILIIWVIIASVPALLLAGIVGFNNTDKWFSPVLDWCVDRLE